MHLHFSFCYSIYLMISLTCLNNTVQSASELITYSDSDIWADSMLLDLLVELIKVSGVQ